jgi:hypothetical protein
MEVTRTWELTCCECHQRSDLRALGWRAYLTGDDEGEPVEVAVFCPACATREFEADRH